MTIAEIKEKLSLERGFGSRYPARIIFVENLDDYSALEHQLKGICDVTINVPIFAVRQILSLNLTRLRTS